MSFDIRREELLKKLNTIQKEKDTRRINQTVKARLHAQEKESETPQVARRTEEQSMKPKVLIFGTVRIFLGTLRSILDAYCEVIIHDSVEQAADYIIDNHIPVVILDMDPPNDWKQCHDLFTTGKTMYPDIEYIVFHKEKNPSAEVQMLLAQGAHELNKPIDQVRLITLIREILNRRENT